jgi:hypothetical protein
MALWGELLTVAAAAGRVSIGLIFLLAAVQKARAWRLLPGVIANYRLLPGWAVLPVAALLPPLELLLAMGLLSAQLRPWPELMAIALLTLFAGAMAINVAWGRVYIDCGCGQALLAQHLSRPLVARNLVLAALLLPALLPPASVPMPALLSAVAAGLGFFLLYLLFNLLDALPRTRRFA